MAKLSARGRKELARVSKEYIKPDLVTCDVCQGTKIHPSDFLDAKQGDTCTVCKGTGQKPPLTKWERKTLALMSDRTILEKRDVRFQPDWLDKEGRFYSYGWKVKGKAKEGVTPEKFIEIYSKAGFKVES